ncbi:MAG: HD domain-containing protein [Candidatus Omnitrophica bacterium]|nr:HD domain-containing protein [Candidatus Omnitrophota bacterium]
MTVDYQQDLEKAARQMILIHRSSTLTRLILRTIVAKVKVEHAGLFIYDKQRDEYVVKVSRGATGMKIPSGFVKISQENSLIRYFREPSLPYPKDSILWSSLNGYLRSAKRRKNEELVNFLEDLRMTLSLYQARACVPGFFRKELVGVLFLGEKTDQQGLSKEELGYLSVLASDVVMAIKNAWLIEDLNQQVEVNKRLFVQTVSALASSIEAKDMYTIGHTERVVEKSLEIARQMRRRKRIRNWESFLENLRVAALLHDIGKIGIPEKILNKKKWLNEKERGVIERHPLIGAKILQQVEEMKDALLGVKHHHERYDGKGYPSGLRGKEIPLTAAIIAVADSFDAMIIDRPYRKGLRLSEALEEIRKNRGKQFAPAVVDAFLSLYAVPAKKKRK